MFKPVVGKITQGLQAGIILLIIVYRYCVSPLLGNRCRFYPSCSMYLQDALKEYGLIKGIWKALLRILRCHPWHVGGYDPVQQNKIARPVSKTYP